MRNPFLPFALALLAANAAAAPPSNRLIWPSADIAPSMIRSGPQAGTGFLDLAMADLRALLPEYKHETLWGNTKRQEQEMQTGRNTCTVALLRNPRREAFLIYSRPYFRILPVGIITLKSRAAEFDAYRNEHGLVSLAKVRTDSPLQMGIAFGRAYGGTIDKILEPQLSATPKNLLIRSGTDISDGLYGMLQRGRIDYQLGYPVEETHLSRSHPGQKATVFMPIEEAGALHNMYFSCARSPWGERMIARMNRHFESKPLQRKLQKNYERWLSPEALKIYRSWLKQAPPLEELK